MGRAHLLGDIGVILGALVGVLDHQADRGSGGLALKHAGENLHLICLAALGGIARGAGLAPVQLQLDVFRADFQSRRATIDDTAQGRTVAFAKGGNAKQLAKSVAGHMRDSVTVCQSFIRGKRRIIEDSAAIWAGAIGYIAPKRGY